MAVEKAGYRVRGLWSAPPCPPHIMSIIISGQVRTSAANSSVDAGTPSARRPTTRIASAMAYSPPRVVVS
jgi:hypothetical protein